MFKGSYDGSLWSQEERRVQDRPDEYELLAMGLGEENVLLM